jgi:cytochrome P450
MLEPFGPNVVTTQGDLWRLHLKITLPPFGDAVNRLVWSETFRQTNLLASAWSTQASDNLKIDIYSVTLNVMVYAAFGQQSDWTDGSATLPPGHELSLVKAICGVVLNLPHILLLPQWLLKRSPWKHVYTAYNEFERYLHELLDAEKARIAMDDTYNSKVKGNLLTAILKSNKASKDESVDSKGQRTTLTDKEILGNAFMFLLAGMY